jgi:hypothetical protein
MSKEKEPSREMKASSKREERLAEKRRKQKARREARKAGNALEQLYKPIEEWDDEELARGRPRAADGSFRGRSPGWVTRELHEESIRRFTTITQNEMRALVPAAIENIAKIAGDTSCDEKGKPNTPAAVRLAANQWIVEHLVGKPKQRLEADISVKLQGILAEALVSPDQVGDGYIPAIDVQSWEGEDEEDLDSQD